MHKDLFINAIQMVDFRGLCIIPSVLYYGPDNKTLIGSAAIEAAQSRHLLNEDFKVDLGNSKPGSFSETKQKFQTAAGKKLSADVITHHFLTQLLSEVKDWLERRDYEKAPAIIIAEPVSMQEAVERNWLPNYRDWLERICYGND